LKTQRFWKTQLEGVKPLNFGDFPRPANPTGKGARVPLQFSPALVNKLNQVRKEAKTTIFTLLLAAVKTLLLLYSGQDDIAVGTAAANRANSEWEGIIV
jgi:Condensation domain